MNMHERALPLMKEGLKNGGWCAVGMCNCDTWYNQLNGRVCPSEYREKGFDYNMAYLGQKMHIYGLQHDLKKAQKHLAKLKQPKAKARWQERVRQLETDISKAEDLKDLLLTLPIRMRVYSTLY